MTLKTLTGPSIPTALADARRLFGPDVVLLQSSPAGPGSPASVTVAFDGPSRPAPRRAAPAVPEPVAQTPARAYGYGAARQVRPAAAAPFSPPALASPAPDVSPTYLYRQSGAAYPATSPLPLGEGQGEGSTGTESHRMPLTPALAAADAGAVSQREREQILPQPISEPSASADEVAALRARLVELEAALAEVRAAAPPPAPGRPPLVLVGRAGSGKTTLALRLAQSPDLVEAECPAVLVVAPESGPFLDPAPTFWDAGVPVAVVRTAADTAEALRTFADADLLIVDTPSLPVQAERAQPLVARLGRVLAPLAAVEVMLTVDATRSPRSLPAASLAALGLRPDALALSRLDEGGSADAWHAHLGLPVRFASAGMDVTDVAVGAAVPDRAPERPPLAASAPRVPAARPSSAASASAPCTAAFGDPEPAETFCVPTFA